MRRTSATLVQGAAATFIFVATPLLSPVQAVQVEDPPPNLVSLKTIPVPMPDDLSSYVTDLDAALKLGKALFWDMQMASHGKQACASCHFAAGADPLSPIITFKDDGLSSGNIL